MAQTKTLEQLQQDVDDANRALEAGKKLKAEGDKKAFQDKLKSAETVFSALDKDSQAAVIADPAIRLLFAAFDVPKRKSGKGKGGRYDKDAILAFLSDGEKENQQIAEHLNTSKQSVNSWRKKDELKGLVETEKRGKKRFWRRV